ncbi:MBL fold metallo-hydrolase [Agarivorans gilvus]|uniref:Metallo-beta-lactamase domain-containing protein n=1 Tax=Agarivorans gilvus TaxID=680279 RepID=A0ABQ1HWB0_9ALTE|nr:MBL fold metallo-hydrolase [Agarivorans gilvus]GGA93016.1 hypothetical protein GCM10007414_02080 [Agarivorans gilvus]
MAYQIIPVTPFQQNCSLIWCEDTKQAAIVDPGGDPQLIQSAVTNAGVEVSKILLTHGHLDHVGAASILKERYQVPILGPHKDDEFWLSKMAMQCQMFGFPEVASFAPDQWLEHGELIDLGSLQLEVRHCPGHTPGHVVFIDHQHQLAIVGDVLFKGSIGRTDFPKGDHPTLINAIKTQLYTLEDSYRFLPGHGAMSSIGHEKQFNGFTR